MFGGKHVLASYVEIGDDGERHHLPFSAGAQKCQSCLLFHAEEYGMKNFIVKDARESRMFELKKRTHFLFGRQCRAHGAQLRLKEVAWNCKYSAVAIKANRIDEGAYFLRGEGLERIVCQAVSMPFFCAKYALLPQFFDIALPCSIFARFDGKRQILLAIENRVCLYLRNGQRSLCCSKYLQDYEESDRLLFMNRPDAVSACEEISCASIGVTFETVNLNASMAYRLAAIVRQTGAKTFPIILVSALALTQTLCDIAFVIASVRNISQKRAQCIVIGDEFIEGFERSTFFLDFQRASPSDKGEYILQDDVMKRLPVL